MKRVVLCDFDGTITVRDLTRVIWDKYVPFDWRTELKPLQESGVINATEMIRRGYAEVTASKDQLLELIRPIATIRPGFSALVELCRRRAWTFEILSNGLRFYIDAFLPPNVPTWSYEGHFDGRWRVELPPGVDVGPNEDFKIKVLQQIRSRNPDSELTYIGDGRLDFEVARRCDRVFAVHDSTLEKLCQKHGVAHRTFVDFNEVVAALADLPG